MGLSPLQGIDTGGLGQNGNQEGRKGESDRPVCQESPGHINHPHKASRMSPASLPTASLANSLASSCLRHSHCFCSRRSSAASLVLAAQRMGPALCLPAPGAAAGDRDTQLVTEPAAPTVPGEPSLMVTRPHLVVPGTHCLLLLSREQYQGVGLAFTGVSRATPAGWVWAAGAPLSPSRLLTTARTGWWPKQVPECGFSRAGSCSRAGLKIRS